MAVSWPIKLDGSETADTPAAWDVTSRSGKGSKINATEHDNTVIALREAVNELHDDKADKVSGATNNDIAGLDAGGDLKSLGSFASYAGANLATPSAAGFMSADDKDKLNAFVDPRIIPGPGEGDLDFDSVTDTGYYGEVSAGDFLRGDDLASLIGLSAGTAQHSDGGWLKFKSHGKILFVAKKPFRNNLSWNDINAADAVHGDRQIVVGGRLYKVRLLTGADNDPSTYTYGTSCADDPGVGSEWNDLMYRIHEDDPNCTDVTEGMPEGSETTRHGGPQVGDSWAGLSDADIITASGNGRACWCQEVDGQDSGRRVGRGSSGVAFFLTATAGTTNTNYGWRPVLELA